MHRDRETVLLIAEDNQGNYALLTRLLGRANITASVLHFSDGKVLLDFLMDPALQISHSRRNYVILLDLNLPKINGLDVLERIKSSDNLKHIPVLIMTAARTPETRELCFKMGCDAYFVKPLDSSEFFKKLSEIGISLPVEDTDHC